MSISEHIPLHEQRAQLGLAPEWATWKCPWCSRAELSRLPHVPALRCLACGTLTTLYGGEPWPW